jgi:DNA mismatch repair ATPase MutL
MDENNNSNNQQAPNSQQQSYNQQAPNSQQQSYNQQAPNSQQQSYNQQAPNYQQPYNQSYQSYNNGSQLEPPLTLGNWIVIMILVAIPCVNIVMLFIWAFGKDVNTSKKNYSRAMLIFMLIGVILGLIFGSVIGSMVSSLGGMYY